MVFRKYSRSVFNGLLFISTIGSTETIYCVSILLCVLGVFHAAHDRRTLATFFVGICVLLLAFYLGWPPSHKNTLYEKETNYYSAKVIDTELPLLGESRVLLLDLDIHSVDACNARVIEYTDMYPVFKHLKDDIQNILVLGAGAYTLPKHFSDYYPDATVSVVEVDPEMVSIGNTYFNLRKHDIRTVIDDAKLFIRRSTETYDVIFGDAYNSYISVPWYLLTKEWNDEVRARLTPNGLYAINFIGSLDRDTSAFTKSVIATFEHTFPHYYVFSFGGNRAAIQNIVLVGVNGDLPSTEEVLMKTLLVANQRALSEKIVPRERIDDSGAVLLTDNYSPV